LLNSLNLGIIVSIIIICWTRNKKEAKNKEEGEAEEVMRR